LSCLPPLICFSGAGGLPARLPIMRETALHARNGPAGLAGAAIRNRRAAGAPARLHSPLK